MLQKRLPITVVGAALLVSAGSCTENVRPTRMTPAPTPPPLSTEPIGVQVARAHPRLAGSPFRVLLDFERATDLAFVNAPPGSTETAADKSHTGSTSLRLTPSSEISVKVGSLVHGSFPGAWTMAGAYFCGDGAGATVTLSYRDVESPAPPVERRVALAQPGKWQGVFLDLTGLAPQSAGGLLSIRIDGGPVHIDDVTVVNNARTLHEPKAAGDWTIREGGLAIVVERPARFKFTLKTPDALPDGWTCDEANALRARFTSASGKAWTIYADGRQYRDGQFDPQGSTPDVAPRFARQHESPATVAVAEEFGRLDRDTPGDKDNDGYNELRGAYQLVASGGNRFEVQLRPTAPLVKPVLEIARLPAGEVLATVEGRLIDDCARLPNGNLLIELPVSTDRPTTLNLRVK